MKSKILGAAGLVFGSGAAALIYQTAWLREFRLVFGSSTAASAAVLAIFMGGLGLGSVVLGRRVESQARPLLFYAKLELLIAASAALTPALIWLIRGAYLSAGGTLTLGIWFGTIVRLLLAAIALLTPTFLMGGTLPALARFAVSAEDESRRGLAVLYGVNTLGAVTGAMLGTFVLFECFGNHRTLWLACALNAIVAGLAFWAARSEPAVTPAKVKQRQAEARPAVSQGVVLWSAALSGFLFLLMEIVWFRLLSPILGGTTFTMGLILAVALLGIGAGGTVYGFAARKRTPTLGGLAATCAIQALCLAIPFALGDRLALASMLLQPLGTLGFYARVAGWTALCGIAIFPAAFVAGIQFPLLLGLLGKGQREIGAQTGAAYAWNTGGAIAGSLAGGFLLVPLLSATGVWRLVVCGLSVWALGAAVESGRATRSWLRAVFPIATSAVAVCLLFASLGPTAAWRHGQFGVSTHKNYDMSSNQVTELLNSQRRDVLWEADGVEATIGVSKDDSLAFIINGKPDGNIRGDAGTQVMAGVLGGLFHPHPTRVAVVGLGTGSSAGWLAAIPSVERVDVMELEPLVAKFTAQCALANQNIMQNPKLHLMIGDARETLLTLREPYDIIVSEPSNPYRVGVANLFTREYYEAARARLRPGGLFVQWLQTYRVDYQTVSMFYATFQSVFPHVETWQTQGGDLLLIGSQETAVYDVAALRERIKQPPFHEAFTLVWRTNDLEGVFSHYLSNSDFPNAILAQRRIPLNTDDRPLLEFAFARNLTDHGAFNFTSLRRTASLSDTERPRTTSGELDWNKVETNRLEMFLAFDQDIFTGADDDPAAQKLGAALQSYSSGLLADAFNSWSQLNREPRTIPELFLVAECLAEKGDASAVPYVDRLRELQMPETEAVAARYLWRAGQAEKAVAMLEAAFAKFRTNPWPTNPVSKRAITLAVEIANTSDDAAIGARLYQALERPFAVYNVDEFRRDGLLSVAVMLDRAGHANYCVAEIEKAEPFVPWNVDFLRLRETVYATAHHPLASAASRDVESFLAGEDGLVRKEPPPAQPKHVASLAE